MLDGDLPTIIANLLLEHLNTGVSTLKDLAERITETNPLKYDVEQSSPFYAYKIKHLLTSTALGMMPATAWSGKFDANGGYLVVKMMERFFVAISMIAIDLRTIYSQMHIWNVRAQLAMNMLQLLKKQTEHCRLS